MRALGQPISAVASSTGARAVEFAAKHDIPSPAADVDELLARDDVDAVYISTVNRLHGPHTLAAAAAGKHVLCEKPVAMDLPEAWSMVQACAAAALVFGVNHHLPSHTTHTRYYAWWNPVRSAYQRPFGCSSPSNWRSDFADGG